MKRGFLHRLKIPHNVRKPVIHIFALHAKSTVNCNFHVYTYNCTYAQTTCYIYHNSYRIQSNSLELITFEITLNVQFMASCIIYYTLNINIINCIGAVDAEGKTLLASKI